MRDLVCLALAPTEESSFSVRTYMYNKKYEGPMHCTVLGYGGGNSHLTSEFFPHHMHAIIKLQLNGPKRESNCCQEIPAAGWNMDRGI